MAGAWNIFRRRVREDSHLFLRVLGFHCFSRHRYRCEHTWVSSAGAHEDVRSHGEAFTGSRSSLATSLWLSQHAWSYATRHVGGSSIRFDDARVWCQIDRRAGHPLYPISAPSCHMHNRDTAQHGHRFRNCAFWEPASSFGGNSWLQKAFLPPALLEFSRFGFGS